jgi:hypothetical protein
VLGQPHSGRRVPAEQFDAFPDQRRPALHDLVAQAEHVAPHVVGHPVVVPAGARHPLLVYQAELDQITHPAGNRGRADLKDPGQLGRGEPAGLRHQQGDEDPGRHRRDPGGNQHGREPFEVTEQRVFRSWRSV